MFFWLREICGWLLVLLALWLIRDGVNRVSATEIVEAAVVMFTALGVLRLGILLIRVSTAARICLKEERRMASSAQGK